MAAFDTWDNMTGSQDKVTAKQRTMSLRAGRIQQQINSSLGKAILFSEHSAFTQCAQALLGAVEWTCSSV